MAETRITIARDELYRRVWEAPLKHLLEEYGLTYAELCDVARKLNVPRPPKGYWNQHAVGMALQQPLPELKPGQMQSCEVRRGAEESRLHEERKQAITASLGKITAPTRLVRPHPLVAGWIAERRAHERYSCRQSTMAPSFFELSETDTRRHRILQALLPALERKGARVTGEHDEGEISAHFTGATIAFRLREKLKQGRRPLTEREQRWSSSKDRLELRPSGILCFKIETYSKIGWRTWEDAAERLLEERLVEIATTILLARDSVIEEAREAKRKQILAQQREEVRRAKAEQRAREETCWNDFVSLSRRADEAAHLWRFLERLEAAGLALEQQYGERTVSDWLAWARERIMRLDPFSAGASQVFASLARVQPTASS